MYFTIGTYKTKDGLTAHIKKVNEDMTLEGHVVYRATDLSCTWTPSGVHLWGLKDLDLVEETPDDVQ